MNKSLPICAFRDQIVKSVDNNQATIVVAQTGAGKSTQVPQFLVEEGYNVVHTQPRRIAARTVAKRVAEEMGEELGGYIVGYHIAHERRCDPDKTRLIFATDGLQLIRELLSLGKQKQILVVDEVHEWNLNIETLVAWAKLRIAEGDDFKLVLMSATLEVEKLTAYFDGAPVIEVPGRLFPVEVIPRGESQIADVVNLLRQGRNVLWFQPGKAEIEACVSALQGVDAEVLPLHGELDGEEQDRCFACYARPKCVVATNIAQTSVTIDDIDAVVDSGVERRVELVDGVEGLYLRPISRADSEQRKGRAGRTKPGVYIDWCPTGDRLDFPKAEILRSRLDQTVLRLACAGFDMEELRFFHQPDIKAIQEARRALQALGCMDAERRVTRIGERVSHLPVSVHIGRMLVEAEKLHVVDDVVMVAAIMEQGGITVPPPSRNNPDRPDWRDMVPSESESDIMGQLAIWQMANVMKKDEMKKKGVSLKGYYRAKEIHTHLVDALGSHVRRGSTGRREDILKAVCAGMVDHLYKESYGYYTNGEGSKRELGSGSLVSDAEWLVGNPFDLQIKTRRGMMTLHLLVLASKVDPMWLAEIAPQLVEHKTGLSPRYDAEKDVVVSTTQMFFNGHMVKEEEVADGQHPEAAKVFARWLSNQCALSPTDDASVTTRDLAGVIQANATRQERARQLNIRAGEEIFKVYSPDEMFELFARALMGARRMSEVMRPKSLVLPSLDEVLIDRIFSENPDTITILGQKVGVEYRAGYMPRVRLDFCGDKSQDWIKLPDDGIQLPGGREVSMYSSIEGYGYYVEAASSQFKEQARECLNQEMWEKWRKPELPAPIDSVPPIVEAEYGRCMVTGISLIAYGTVNHDSWYGSWKSYWTRDRAEAEQVHAKAKDKFVEAREKIVRDALKKRVGELYNYAGQRRDLPEEIRSRLYKTYHGYSGGATTVAEMEAFIAEVEAAVSTAERLEAELAAKEARGEILRNFAAWVHTSSQCGDGGGYVISPDGSLRPHDRDEYERSHGRGAHHIVWDVVAPDEVAVEWSGFRNTANSATIRKAPVGGGYTHAQVETLNRLAQELGREWYAADGVAMYAGAWGHPDYRAPKISSDEGGAFARRAREAAKTPKGQNALAEKLAELKKFGVGGKA